MHANVRSLRDYRPNVTDRSVQPAVGTTLPPDAPKPRLLDQVREAIRTRHYSPRTEEAYVGWIKRFIFYHNKRHPAEMGEQEIAQFLSSLASESHVSASTQKPGLEYHLVPLPRGVAYTGLAGHGKPRTGTYRMTSDGCPPPTPTA